MNNNSCKLILFVFLFCFGCLAEAATVHQQIYINRGEFVTVKSTTFPFLAFNETADYNSLNVVLNASTDDTLILHIHNNDYEEHGFAVKGFASSPVTISPGDSSNYTFYSAEEKIFIYYDPLNYPENRYMGLGGMICINNSSSQKYYWNIKEHQTQFNVDINDSLAVDFSSYNPDYFTINGKSFPDLQMDETAIVNAEVGETVLIFVANTGQSLHSIHFHGFHCRAVYSTSQRIGQNWIKDTFPVYSMEAVVLELIPDKSGQYSVHDHNLVAVSGGGTHPNGMFLIMTIE